MNENTEPEIGPTSRTLKVGGSIRATIPATICELTGIKIGDVLEWTAIEPGMIRARKLQ